jgi:predicted nucleic acid-binding protein
VSEKPLPRIYADANIVTELGAYGRGWHKPERENDIWFFRQILQAAEDEQLEIYTCSITLSECSHIKDNSDPDHLQVVMDEKAQDFFKKLLSSGTLIKLVQDSVFVAEAARDLMWKHNLVLKGMDAIHVASAIDAQCKEFLTWDTDMSKEKTAEKITALRGLGMSVITPSQSSILGPEYKQVNLLTKADKLDP